MRQPQQSGPVATSCGMIDSINYVAHYLNPRPSGQNATGVGAAGNYFTDVDLVKSGFDGEHTESNHRLMYT
jgi:hypothetical protein